MQPKLHTYSNLVLSIFGPWASDNVTHDASAPRDGGGILFDVGVPEPTRGNTTRAHMKEIPVKMNKKKTKRVYAPCNNTDPLGKTLKISNPRK